MSPEIKFTSFGIPYVLEFEHVSVVADRQTPSPSSSTFSFCYVENPPPPVPSFSLRSFFKRKRSHVDPRGRTSPDPNSKPLPPPPHDDLSETHGIHIQFPPDHAAHTRTTRKQRLVQLQQAISVAVLDAGMSGSPGNTAHPENHSNGNTPHRTRGYGSADALFCGTYGQLMLALEGAGLSAVPCMGEGLSEYTRLGALFVARNNGTSGIQLRKITLWG